MTISNLVFRLNFCILCAWSVTSFAQPGDQTYHPPQSHRTEPYDVIWTSPSHDSSGSMPLGNGQVGMNLWVEKDGDLRFYISRTDSLTEVSRLVKVGGVRISLDPNPFKSGIEFHQHLRLSEGVCEIMAGKDHHYVTLRIFVDSEQPVIHIIGESDEGLKVRATADVWRTAPHALAGDELNSSWTLHGSPTPVIEVADKFYPVPAGDAVAWYHRNETSSAFASTLKVQSLETVADKVHDPLIHRTFGGWMTGKRFRAADGHAIEAFFFLPPDATSTTAPPWRWALRIAVPCAQTETPQAWLDAARDLAAASADSDAARRRTAAWWHSFWDRSWVIAGPSITEGYTLQRYMQACGGRGTYPIKFNGGVFTVEPRAMGKPYNADWRAWGDCHWWQNVRHMYHPMLASGDFEMMDPLFQLYEAARPLAEARSRLYHTAEGSYFPETMTVWGTYSNGDYGWNRSGRQPKDVLCPWWQYAWNQGPELVDLMLDRWDYTGDEGFLTGQVLPMAESVLKYFDTRFKKDEAGRVILNPTQSVETYWHGVINDMPTTAGLNDITARLCALPERFTSQPQRRFFLKMKAASPTVPIEDAEVGGKPVRRLAPAQKYAKNRSNCENPELYGIWPFRLYGLGRPGLEQARAAFAARHNHLDVGWGYDGNCAALLGLTDEAARILKAKCANSNPSYRWPATWGPNFDWLPDQNHGGNLLETTQLMLLQPVGDKLLLLPAWPKDWDVNFKLRTPRNTVVECIYRSGKIERLVVSPAARRADVTLP
jgi:hypothetical protein